MIVVCATCKRQMHCIHVTPGGCSICAPLDVKAVDAMHGAITKLAKKIDPKYNPPNLRETTGDSANEGA